MVMMILNFRKSYNPEHNANCDCDNDDINGYYLLLSNVLWLTCLFCDCAGKPSRQSMVFWAAFSNSLWKLIAGCEQRHVTVQYLHCIRQPMHLTTTPCLRNAQPCDRIPSGISVWSKGCLPVAMILFQLFAAVNEYKQKHDLISLTVQSAK